MRDLFGESDRHEAGGKVKTRLLPGVKGDAKFAGKRDEYRPVLRRWRGEKFPDEYAVFIGMNPSTAEAAINDPTITREWSFTEREGLAGYVKCNVADYRATYPSDLLAPGLVLRSEENLKTILALAEGAKLVVACWGSVNKALRPLADETAAALRDAGVQLKCFGLTANGSPKHPVRLAGVTPLISF